MMMARILAATAFLAFGATAAFSGSLGAELAPVDCTLTFQPASVVAGGDPVEVQAIPSDETGEITGVAVDPDSGLLVSLVEDRPYTLNVDAAAAAPGEWDVTLRSGEEAACTGALTVMAPDPR